MTKNLAENEFDCVTELASHSIATRQKLSECTRRAAPSVRASPALALTRGKSSTLLPSFLSP